MSTKPYMTSNDLIASVKRKMSFPVSQSTFTEGDILKFANEEMFISQVPSVLEYHQEYFVTVKIIPLQNNLSRYPIPNRATGMKLRDMFWMDTNGNLFEMSRIDEHDSAFFQTSSGLNQSIHKFKIEGNDIVLVPGVVSGPTGYLAMVFYLRPNQLVKNNRAATISGFQQTITINNSLITALDTVIISPDAFYNSPKTLETFTAVNTLGGTITSIIQNGADAALITSVNHQLTDGQTVIITGSNSNPSVDGTWIASVEDADTYSIEKPISIAGNTGTFTSPNQFLIAGTNSLTAANLSAAINSLDIIQESTVLAEVITLTFSNIYTYISSENITAFQIPTQTIRIVFDELNTSYTDSETNITESLFTNESFIDFLKTNPGHNTYIYDVLIPKNGISGNTILFEVDQLLVPTGTINNGSVVASNNAIVMVPANLIPGDYICQANEAIIPQIPPDLHNGLAERTCARILAALGDQQGLQASMVKIQEIESRQGNLLSNRSDGTPQKITGRHGLLRYGKSSGFRRG